MDCKYVQYITIDSVFESHTNRILREQRFSGPHHHQGELSNVIFLPFLHQMEIFQLEYVVLLWCLTKSRLQQIFRKLGNVILMHIQQNAHLLPFLAWKLRVKESYTTSHVYAISFFMYRNFGPGWQMKSNENLIFPFIHTVHVRRST